LSNKKDIINPCHLSPKSSFLLKIEDKKGKLANPAALEKRLVK